MEKCDDELTGPRRPLSLVVSVCSTLSLGCIFVAVVSDNWLYTSEKTQPNGTVVYVTIHSGLWRRCTIETRTVPSVTNCSYINYFSQVDRDGLGSTDSILLSLRRAAIFPVLSFLMLLSGEVVCISSFCSYCKRRRVYAFLAIGILNVVAGLFLFIGFIIYIGAITEEAGNRSKGSSEEQPFSFDYGSSLSLVVFTFFGSEMTGVLAIQLYISIRRQLLLKHRAFLDQVDTDCNSDGAPQPGHEASTAVALAASACSPTTTASFGNVDARDVEWTRIDSKEIEWTRVDQTSSEANSPCHSETCYSEVNATSRGAMDMFSPLKHHSPSASQFYKSSNHSHSPRPQTVSIGSSKRQTPTTDQSETIGKKQPGQSSWTGYKHLMRSISSMKRHNGAKSTLVPADLETPQPILLTEQKHPRKVAENLSNPNNRQDRPKQTDYNGSTTRNVEQTIDQTDWTKYKFFDQSTATLCKHSDQSVLIDAQTEDCASSSDERHFDFPTLTGNRQSTLSGSRKFDPAYFVVDKNTTTNRTKISTENLDQLRRITSV